MFTIGSFIGSMGVNCTCIVNPNRVHIRAKVKCNPHPERDTWKCYDEIVGCYCTIIGYKSQRGLYPVVVDGKPCPKKNNLVAGVWWLPARCLREIYGERKLWKVLKEL